MAIAIIGLGFMRMAVSLCSRRIPSMGRAQGVGPTPFERRAERAPKAPVPGRILKREDVLW
jgi:hypothetical protein